MHKNSTKKMSYLKRKTKLHSSYVSYIFVLSRSSFPLTYYQHIRLNSHRRKVDYSFQFKPKNEMLSKDCVKKKSSINRNKHKYKIDVYKLLETALQLPVGRRPEVSEMKRQKQSNCKTFTFQSYIKNL